MNEVAQLALLLDALLTKTAPGRLNAEVAAVAAQITCHPVVDQIQAAATDQAARADRYAAAVNSPRPSSVTAAAPIPEWARLGVAEALAGFLLNRTATCMHAPTPLAPEPIHAAAWKPGLIACGRCVHLFRVAPNSEADRTCDRCGRITDSQRDEMYPNGVLCGLLVYHFGTCGECAEDWCAGSAGRA